MKGWFAILFLFGFCQRYVFPQKLLNKKKNHDRTAKPVYNEKIKMIIYCGRSKTHESKIYESKIHETKTHESETHESKTIMRG